MPEPLSRTAITVQPFSLLRVSGMRGRQLCRLAQWCLRACAAAAAGLVCEDGSSHSGFSSFLDVLRWC